MTFYNLAHQRLVFKSTFFAPLRFCDSTTLLNRLVVLGRGCFRQALLLGDNIVKLVELIFSTLSLLAQYRPYSCLTYLYLRISQVFILLCTLLLDDVEIGSFAFHLVLNHEIFDRALRNY